MYTTGVVVDAASVKTLNRPIKMNETGRKLLATAVAAA